MPVDLEMKSFDKRGTMSSVSFLFDCSNLEWMDDGVLNFRTLKVSMKVWYVYRFCTVRMLCFLNRGLVCSSSKNVLSRN